MLFHICPFSSSSQPNLNQNFIKWDGMDEEWQNLWIFLDLPSAKNFILPCLHPKDRRWGGRAQPCITTRKIKRKQSWFQHHRCTKFIHLYVIFRSFITVGHLFTPSIFKVFCRCFKWIIFSFTSIRVCGFLVGRWRERLMFKSLSKTDIIIIKF